MLAVLRATRASPYSPSSQASMKKKAVRTQPFHSASNGVSSLPSRVRMVSRMLRVKK
jgi:hypothetical protein